MFDDYADCSDDVSTHSRPKAADNKLCIDKQTIKVSTHSRPKAAGAGICVEIHDL